MFSTQSSGLYNHCSGCPEQPIFVSDNQILPPGRPGDNQEKSPRLKFSATHVSHL